MSAHDENTMLKMNLPKALERLADVYSCPADLILSDDEWNIAVEKRQQQREQMQQLAMAEQASKTIKNVGNAGRAERTNAGPA